MTGNATSRNDVGASRSPRPRVPKRRRPLYISNISDEQRSRYPLIRGDIESSTQNKVVLSDTGLLDCSICLDPLNPPVYQCVHGHLVCESCSNKVNRCPSCGNCDGLNRCILVDKILESTRVSCPNRRYGCSLKLTYGEKPEHEKSCIFIPCSCPFDGCSYVGMSTNLYIHISAQHSDIVHEFDMNFTIRCLFLQGCDQLFFQESRRDTLFVVNRSVVSLGSLFSVVCIAPPLSREKYTYKLTARAGQKEISLKTSVIVAPKCSAQPPKRNCLLITCDFADDLGNIGLELIVRQLD